MSRTTPDHNISNIFLLPDKRKLGYAQYGSSTGQAILYLHGHAASRLEAANLHDFGVELGVRIIALDRPGFGLSSPQPDHTILNYSEDVKQLAEYLKLEDYCVLGVSGGGPFALACAYALPTEKLKCVSIVCGLGPVSEIGMKGARWQNRLGFTIGYRYLPNSLTNWFWRSQPYGRLDWSDEKRLERWMQDASKLKGTAQEKDLEALTDEKFAREALRCGREAFAQGNDAMLLEGRLYGMPFGFRIEDIPPELPVRLWYGKNDVNVPLNHGETIAKRLGDRASLRVVEETHIGIIYNWRKQVLEDLVRST